jgi:hypothetical protein
MPCGICLSRAAARRSPVTARRNRGRQRLPNRADRRLGARSPLTLRRTARPRAHRRFHAPTLRFEVASADAARDLVRAHGMDTARPTRCGTWPCCTPPAGSPTARARKPPPPSAPTSPAWAWTGSTRRPRPDHGHPARLCPPFIDAVVTDLRGHAAGRLLYLDGDHRRRPYPRLRPGPRRAARGGPPVRDRQVTGAGAPMLETARVGVDPDSLHRGGLAPAVPRVAPQSGWPPPRTLIREGKRCEDSSSATPCHWTATARAQEGNQDEAVRQFRRWAGNAGRSPPSSSSRSGTW